MTTETNDLIIENLEVADEILFRLLANSLHIEEKKDIMIADFKRIRHLINTAELFLKESYQEQPEPQKEYEDRCIKLYAAVQKLFKEKYFGVGDIITFKINWEQFKKENEL